MNQYDPQHAPDPAEWLELDERLRIIFCEEHHRRAGDDVPNLQAHAVFHAVVENQIAENFEPVVRALARLRNWRRLQSTGSWKAPVACALVSPAVS